jgi:hypothetical protein
MMLMMIYNCECIVLYSISHCEASTLQYEAVTSSFVIMAVFTGCPSAKASSIPERRGITIALASAVRSDDHGIAVFTTD